MRAALCLASLCAVAVVPSALLADSCEDLASLTITNTIITSSTPFKSGSTPPGARDPSELLPAYCRVLGIAKPLNDSEIHFELWLPAPEVWNGKFVGTGNGGYSSALSFADMARALAKGYATAGSDTGHQGGNLNFGSGHFEKIEDWGFRAVHVMTENAKLIVRNYYGSFPKHSYFTGCSTGGHQALSEAQRYPTDYDGIVAGDPGNERVHLNANFLWAYTALYKEPNSALPAAKLPFITQAALAQCDAGDGITDGIISNPRNCKFDPAVLLCPNGDQSSCLTQPEIDAVRKIYAGAHNTRTGESIMPGFPIGSESGWGAYFVGQPAPARIDFWRLWVFDNPSWNWRTFDFDADLEYADRKLAAVNAVSADLSGFKGNHGKLLLYHGWADPVVPPEATIRYFEDVEKTMGGAQNTSEFARLFMVPGMGHCAGGTGPSTFDALGVLDRWVTSGAAPARIIAWHATNGKVDRTRPLCPFPATAEWRRAGSTDEAESFSCVSPPATRTISGKKPRAKVK